MKTIIKKIWLPTVFLELIDSKLVVQGCIKTIFNKGKNELSVIEMDSEGRFIKAYTTTLEEFEKLYSIELNELR